MVYPAKKAWWVVILVWGGGLLSIGGGTTALYQTVLGAVPPLPGVLLAMVGLAVGLTLWWMLQSTRYKITESNVVAYLGPIRWTIPLANIEQVVATRGLTFRAGVSLAWSLDMLHIYYRKANGKAASPVAISPRDKVAFLRELTEAVPDVKFVKGS